MSIPAAEGLIPVDAMYCLMLLASFGGVLSVMMGTPSWTEKSLLRLYISQPAKQSEKAWVPASGILGSSRCCCVRQCLGMSVLSWRMKKSNAYQNKPRNATQVFRLIHRVPTSVSKGFGHKKMLKRGFQRYPTIFVVMFRIRQCTSKCSLIMRLSYHPLLLLSLIWIGNSLNLAPFGRALMQTTNI